MRDIPTSPDDAAGEQGHERPELKLDGRSWELPTDTKVLNQVWEEVERRLAAAGWDGNEANLMLTGLNEAITNAIEHGNLGVGSEATFANPEDYSAAIRAAAATELAKRHVFVTVDIAPDRINFSVRDEGAGFDVTKVPDPRDDERLLRENGRGVFLMKMGFDIVGYNKTGNQVWLEKRRESAK